MSPDDYRGIVAQVPFVDVVTTMLDDSIPLTTNEYDEWGNPGEREDYDYMLSYSPYDNVRAQRLSGHVHHDRSLGQPGAVLRARQVGRQASRPQDRPQSHCCCTWTWRPGTAANPGRFQRYREIAMEYAFLLDLAGIEVGKKKRRERGKLNRGAKIDAKGGNTRNLKVAGTSVAS